MEAENKDNIIPSGFERIKNELVAKGYRFHEDTFTKIIPRFNQVVVNGQVFNQENHTIIDLAYFGQGYIENIDSSSHYDLYYFNIIVDGADQGSIGVPGWEEMLTMIKI